uniref:5-formyltetrahydrofolate cyclo-ligase n=1 Tax=Parastrongyloides trichosuri TaxID=131310 RepID=A0A0N4ZSQ8_PARTI
MSLSTAKSILRKETLNIIKKLNNESIMEESENVVSQILNDPIYKASQIISIYLSTHSEIQTDVLVKDSLNSGKTVFIPHFEKGSDRMEMLLLPSLDSFNKLTCNFYGIRQYYQKENEVSFTNKGPIDLVICPLVAASKDGYRLGHGKGYYDKFFSEHIKLFEKPPKAYGVALKCQIKENEEIPIEKNDYKLDKVFFAL